MQIQVRVFQQRFVAIVGLSLLTGLAQVATAQTPCPTTSRSKAVKLARRANQRMREKAFTLAMDDLHAAYALCPDARLRHSMGCVLEASGALPDALAAFHECVREAPDDEMRAECLEREDALREQLESGGPRAVAEPMGAGVTPDGAPTPHPTGRAITVTSGRRDLDVPASEPILPVPATQPPRPSTAWNWVGIGASLALLGVGTGFLGQYGKDRSDARGAEYFPAEQCTPTALNSCIRREADTVTPTNAIVGGVCAGAGVAVLITSVALWPRLPTPIAASPIPGGGGWVVVGGRW